MTAQIDLSICLSLSPLLSDVLQLLLLLSLTFQRHDFVMRRRAAGVCVELQAPLPPLWFVDATQRITQACTYFRNVKIRHY
jgi:hypothetical protein